MKKWILLFILLISALLLTGCGAGKEQVVIYTSMEDYRVEYLNQRLKQEFPDYEVVVEYLPEEEQKEWQRAFARRYVTADEVLEAHPEVANELVEQLPERLEENNRALKGTPFEVSYRVLNELTIMVGVMLDDGKTLKAASAQSVNNMLLMKILPRIEGDAEMFALSREYKNKVGVDFDNRLEWLKDLAPDLNEPSPEATADNGGAAGPADKDQEHQQTAKEKIEEMMDRLNNQEFTRFWP